MDFSKIAPYLQDPLVLIGFALLLFFGLARALLKAGIIPTLTRAAGFHVVSRLLLYGFILALVIIALGFALKYRELSEKEQRAAVNLLQQEIVGNLATIEELKKNTETILSATNTITRVLRHPGIPLLSTLFPKENIDPTANVPASLDLARQQLESARDKGLLADELERQKFNAAASAVAGTISRTMSAIESLSDNDRTRYQISSATWDTHLPILRKVHVVDVPSMQSVYQDSRSVRINYGVTVDYCIKYLKTLQTFFTQTKEPITPQRLAGVLAAERLFFITVSKYAETVVQKIERIAEVQDSISGTKAVRP